MADTPKPKELELRWDNVEGFPVAASNVFAAQFTHGEFTLTFGYAAPPFQQEATSVMARPVARISLSPARMQELVDILKTNLENFQKASIAAATAKQTKH